MRGRHDHLHACSHCCVSCGSCCRTTTLSPYSPSPQRAARPGGPVRYGLMTPLRAPSPLRPGPTPHRAGPTSMQRNWQH